MIQKGSEVIPRWDIKEKKHFPLIFECLDHDKTIAICHNRTHIDVKIRMYYGDLVEDILFPIKAIRQ